MRIIKIIFITLLALTVIFFAGVFIFLKTVDLNRFKNQIAEKISETIDRDVTLKHISLDFSVIRGITLNMSGLSIMDHPAFSKEPMLYVDTSHLRLDMLSFLVKRQILISEIELDSPKVILIRNNEGQLNFQALVPKETAGPETDSPGALSFAGDVVGGAGEERSKDFGLEEILIRSLHVQDGTFIFMDYTQNPSIMIPLREIDFRVSNFSLEEPFPFEGKASLFSDRANIQLNGLARVSAESGQVRVDDVKMPVDLSSFLMEAVYEGIPSSKGAGLLGGVSGQMILDIRQMILGPKGLLVLSSDGRLKGVNMTFAGSPFPVEGLEAAFSVTDSNIDLQKMTLPLASGEITIEGRIADYLSDRQFSADLKLTDIQLSELGSRLELPIDLEGQLSGTYKLNGSGMDQKTLQSSLRGEGGCDIQNGRIKDMNLLRTALNKISFFPDLVSQIESNLPERYKEKLKAKDTVLEKVSIGTKISDGMIFINEAEVNADGFLVLASGQMDFKQELRLNADIYISSDLSASMVAASEGLKYFLDEAGRIHIPLRPYAGPLAKFRTYPDVEDIGKKILRDRGKQELKKALFKALDIDEENPEGTPSEGTNAQAQSPSSNQSGPDQEAQPHPEEQMIEDILDMIPIFK